MKYNGVIQRKFSLLDKHLLQLQHHLKGVEFSSFKDDYALRCMSIWSGSGTSLFINTKKWTLRSFSASPKTSLTHSDSFEVR